MTSLLIYDLNDFTPSGTLCYYKEKVESELAIMMPTTPLKELYNLYRYVQHLMMMKNLTIPLIRKLIIAN